MSELNEDHEGLKFKCEECGKEIDPDPDCMVELQLDLEHEMEEGEEWKGECSAPELSLEDREKVKSAYQIDDATLDKVLSEGTASIGGVCVCKSCQNQAHLEQYGWKP